MCDDMFFNVDVVDVLQINVVRFFFDKMNRAKIGKK